MAILAGQLANTGFLFVDDDTQFCRPLSYPGHYLLQMLFVVIVAGEVREADATFIGALPLIVFSQLDFKAVPMKGNAFSDLRG